MTKKKYTTPQEEINPQPMFSTPGSAPVPPMTTFIEDKVNIQKTAQGAALKRIKELTEADVANKNKAG